MSSRHSSRWRAPYRSPRDHESRHEPSDGLGEVAHCLPRVKIDAAALPKMSARESFLPHYGRRFSRRAADSGADSLLIRLRSARHLLTTAPSRAADMSRESSNRPPAIIDGSMRLRRVLSYFSLKMSSTRRGDEGTESRRRERHYASTRYFSYCRLPIGQFSAITRAILVLAIFTSPRPRQFQAASHAMVAAR